jgi:hypothetical protein
MVIRPNATRGGMLQCSIACTSIAAQSLRSVPLRLSDLH